MTKTVRAFSPIGPCITLGTLTKETKQFYVYEDRRFGEPTTGKVMKPTEFKYSRNHIEPCVSCRDHARTQYPDGYMD